VDGVNYGRLPTDVVMASPTLVQRHVSLLPPMERQGVVGEVASPSLEGGQVAVLRPNAASLNWARNEGSILLSWANVYAPWHKTRENTKKAPNFSERRQHEVRRKSLLCARMNTGT
jgi:hypothetical protein